MALGTGVASVASGLIFAQGQFMLVSAVGLLGTLAAERTGACSEACPKGLDPTRAIETLRGLSRKRQALAAQRDERQKTLVIEEAGS